MIEEYNEFLLSNYSYHLPEDFIAKYPLEKRDSSKLLQYKNQKISHSYFHNLPDLIPNNSVFVLNSSKVIPARIKLNRATGAKIELLITNSSNKRELSYSLDQTNSVEVWALGGNTKKWKIGETISNLKNDILLNATLIDKQEKDVLVRLEWNKEISFAEMLNNVGEIPLPPYMNRDTGIEDTIRYQTVYANQAGSIAAPTAGLHFTQEVLNKLLDKGCQFINIELQVGAGTFIPITVDDIRQHKMHKEFIRVEKSTLEILCNAWLGNRNIIAVGTTSLRTLESLLAIPTEKMENIIPQNIAINQTPKERFQLFQEYILNLKSPILDFSTQLMIMPSHRIDSINGLITNFHQPNSTLLLLISAIVGNSWKHIYNEALEENYRFLSYGDSSLLWIE
jgi:S-adenosylmethionine:tRNA ribosyltransferase-isomerase